MLDWNAIDSVLLDMDGTLLDLHFDSYFWLQHLPARYAAIHGVAPDIARQQLLERIMKEQGSLNWYCVDYWSHELRVDIAALKQEIADKVAFRPQVPDFLRNLRQAGKRAVIVTNAHRKSLDLKLARTGLQRCVDRIICSHDYGLPKEQPEFWRRLQADEPFDPARTLLIDDSLAVLRSAERFGIGNLLCIAQPDSQQPARETDGFRALRYFHDLGLGR